MRSHLNENLLDTATPPIPEARAWLARYEGTQGAAINLAQAVPGAPPPLELRERLGAAAADPANAGYGPITGEPGLVASYAEDIGHVYGYAPRPAEIAITSGCNEAFFVAMLALAKAGDAILLPYPWYFNHQMTLRMLGITVLPLPTHAARGFVPDAGESMQVLAEHRRANPGQKVRGIVLVTPNNPTGAVIPASVLEAFAALADQWDCWLVLDETYRDFRAEPRTAPHGLFQDPTSRQRLIQLYSFSKAYAVPGHRVGALVAPEQAMTQIGKVLDCMQICAPRHAQTALAWAVPNLRDWRLETARDLMGRGQRFAGSLAEATGWRIAALGAYFAYVRHPFEGEPAVKVARRLATGQGVLALPGSYFGPGQEFYLRFAYANVEDGLVDQVGGRLSALGG